MTTILFYFFSILTLVSATFVIASTNPIHSVLYLILVFCSTSGLFILIGVEFLSMVFLMVYVGAIAVLFLFVVMMLNVKVVEFNLTMLRYLPLGGIIGFIFLIEILLVLDSQLIPLFGLSVDQRSSNFSIWSEEINYITNIESIGNYIYTDYFLLFLLAGMILLVAMVGAIVLTMYKRGLVRKQDIYTQVSRNFRDAIQLHTS
uniref:NADH-ubiquinone oxidoreductase chain 6 n=1 Tax=Moramonas marocensis TaxID=1805496 RepID=A0A140F2I5_9EUKA|nr:NADH dehydrogenase subunit 6 [Moramonas marocensis]